MACIQILIKPAIGVDKNVKGFRMQRNISKRRIILESGTATILVKRKRVGKR